MLQFRLRTLFITTTAAAVLFWAFFVPPQWLGLWAICLMYILLPAAAVGGIVFHRGYWQAFFIGMAPWIVIVLFWGTAAQLPWSPVSWPFDSGLFTGDPGQIISDKLVLAVPLVLAVASGLVAVGIRWWALSATRPTDRDY
jgi:hypothetical protein